MIDQNRFICSCFIYKTCSLEVMRLPGLEVPTVKKRWLLEAVDMLQRVRSLWLIIIGLYAVVFIYKTCSLEVMRLTGLALRTGGPHGIGLYAIVLFTRLIKRNKNKKRGMQQWYLHSGLLNFHLVWIRGPHVIGLYAIVLFTRWSKKKIIKNKK